MKAVHRLLLVAVAWWLRQGGAPTVAEGCQHACGNMLVPQPFGLEPRCALSEEFVLNCSNPKPKGMRQQLLWGNSTVRKISPKDSTMVISLPVNHPCGLPLVEERLCRIIVTKTLPPYKDVPKTVDVVLDWMVGWNSTCKEANLNKSSYACGNNANCSDVGNVPGYRCVCNDGYEGNPYDRNQGCQDIDECKARQNPCPGNKKCQNMPGSYNCVQNRPGFPLAAIAGIVVFAFVIVVSASASSTWKWTIRMINFRRNGGEHLKRARVQIFTEAELAKATNNYDKSNKLGEDGFGPVYKGRLEGDANVEIMVKKPKDVHKHLVRKDFQHELKIVMQISTKYVMKLRGICLETRIPLLVYAYISNDTLFEHIHHNVSIILRSWKNRLKIAVESALALKHIHSCAIIHGNVKSANILLVQNCSVKVFDIGTSVLVSPEHRHITATDIEGMLGYIDPEYLKTCKLTLKSDVYSFGAVLVELLTGKKPTECVTTSEDSMDIIPYFVSSVKDEKLSNVIDFEAANEEMDEVKKVAEIAVKCLEQSSRKRPTMGEVAQQLAAIDASLIDEGENEGTTLEVNVATDISFTASVADKATGLGTSSYFSCLGMHSACPCI